jgi:hypothetical protein
LFRQGEKDYEVCVCNDDDLETHAQTEKVVNEFIQLGMPIQYFYTGQYKRGEGWSVETYPYNVGIRHATGEILLLNSGDVMSISNTINFHRHYQTREGIDGKLIVFSTVHGLTKETQSKIDTYDWKTSPMKLLYKGSCEFMYCGIGVSFSNKFDTEESFRPYHYQMSVRKKAVDEIRGFDEDFYGKIPGGDDDFYCRLVRSGCRTFYAANILAVHQNHVLTEKLTSKGFAYSSPKIPLNFWEIDRQFCAVLRNPTHEWGQYPRDMNSLPELSTIPYTFKK